MCWGPISSDGVSLLEAYYVWGYCISATVVATPDVICIPLIHIATLTDTVWEYYCLTDPWCISFDVYSKSSSQDLCLQIPAFKLFVDKKRQLTNFFDDILNECIFWPWRHNKVSSPVALQFVLKLDTFLPLRDDKQWCIVCCTHTHHVGFAAVT